MPLENQSAKAEAERPTIVVVAYNRPDKLRRLLQSLSRTLAVHDRPTKVIVSVDGGHPETLAVARSSPIEDVEVIAQTSRKGLREHVLWCGDLCERYGAIVVLEDDLILSPVALDFVARALPVVRQDPRVAALSLYAFDTNEFSRLPLNRAECVGDIFYARTGSSWGQVWWRDKWAEFRTWLARDFRSDARYHVPSTVSEWPERSWKKLFNYFLSETAQYTAVPRYSLALALGEAGENARGNDPLSFSMARTVATEIEIKPRHDTLCLDAFLEFETDHTSWTVPGTTIAISDVEFDAFGTKRRADVGKACVLTARKQAPSAVIASFSESIGTPLLALCSGIPGTGLQLVRTSQFDDRGLLSRSAAELRNYCGWLSNRDLLRLSLRAVASKIALMVTPER